METVIMNKWFATLQTHAQSVIAFQRQESAPAQRQDAHGQIHVIRTEPAALMASATQSLLTAEMIILALWISVFVESVLTLLMIVMMMTLVLMICVPFTLESVITHKSLVRTALIAASLIIATLQLAALPHHSPVNVGLVNNVTATQRQVFGQVFLLKQLIMMLAQWTPAWMG
jgi:glucan phosphoethanolaminetransferase (alkaline phosphatase superfamily)